MAVVIAFDRFFEEAEERILGCLGLPCGSLEILVNSFPCCHSQTFSRGRRPVLPLGLVFSLAIGSSSRGVTRPGVWPPPAPPPRTQYSVVWHFPVTSVLSFFTSSLSRGFLSWWQRRLFLLSFPKNGSDTNVSGAFGSTFLPFQHVLFSFALPVSPTAHSPSPTAPTSSLS